MIYIPNRKISPNIPLDVYEVAEAILRRQSAPWNNGRINDYEDFDILQELFRIINLGIPKENFMYQGDLFRIHTSYISLASMLDKNKERIVGPISSDDSCSVLSITEYSDKLVAFSKSSDFTRRVFYKVYPKGMATMFHINTAESYGIDVNAFLSRFDIENLRFEEEYEVLFPLQEKYIIKEYQCTPNQFNYYMRDSISNL